MDADKLYNELELMGFDAVEEAFFAKRFSTRKLPLVELWLSRKRLEHDAQGKPQRLEESNLRNKENSAISFERIVGLSAIFGTIIAVITLFLGLGIISPLSKSTGNSPPIDNQGASQTLEITSLCEGCPEMVGIQGGVFKLGSSLDENGRSEDEDTSPGKGGEQVPVEIEYDLLVSRYEITNAEFQLYVDDVAPVIESGCEIIINGMLEKEDEISWNSEEVFRGPDHPVVCIDQIAATQYAEWLSSKTGKQFRLLSETEWEFLAKGGVPKDKDLSRRRNASDWVCKHDNVADRSLKGSFDMVTSIFRCDDGYDLSAPVNSFPPNSLGLVGMTGNVAEWTEDCYVDSHSRNSGDGSAVKTKRCKNRVIKGGSWWAYVKHTRHSARNKARPDSRFQNVGFRVAIADNL